MVNSLCTHLRFGILFDVIRGIDAFKFDVFQMELFKKSLLHMFHQNQHPISNPPDVKTLRDISLNYFGKFKCNETLLRIMKSS